MADTGQGFEAFAGGAQVHAVDVCVLAKAGVAEDFLVGEDAVGADIRSVCESKVRVLPKVARHRLMAAGGQRGCRSEQRGPLQAATPAPGALEFFLAARPDDGIEHMAASRDGLAAAAGRSLEIADAGAAPLHESDETAQKSMAREIHVGMASESWTMRAQSVG